MNISPINLSFDTAARIGERALEWCNYNIPPKLMKLTNTGKTVMLSGKWYQERPYVKEGPLKYPYIFSQIHFHWGPTDFEGSEHGIEGKKMAMEMHVVHFNAKYKSLEEAKNKADGIAVVAFFFQIEDEQNDSMCQMISQLPRVNNAFTSVNIEPFPLGDLNLEMFKTNYFLYCGAVGRGSKPHLILWLIYPLPIPISHEHVAQFRDLKTSNGDLMTTNCHEIQNIINPNGVFFLDQIVDRGHRKESSLFCLPSLKNTSKMLSISMSEQNLHTLNLERETNTKVVTNTEFLQKAKVPSDEKSNLQELKIQPPGCGEKIATFGSTDRNEVEIALHNQRNWNEDPYQGDNSRKMRAINLLSRLKRENRKELDSVTDWDSEISIGDAIGSTTFRLSSKREYAASSNSQDSIHDSKETINVVEFQDSDVSLRETRGSTMIRFDSDTKQCQS